MRLPLPTDRLFRVPRKWSNQVLRRLASHFTGDVINVSGWDDRDKEGGRYRDYFTNSRSYSISNYSGERGAGDDSGASDYRIDLLEELPENLRRAFDVVFNHTTLEHIFDVNTAFANLCRMSRDIVIVVVPFSQVTHTTDSFGDYWRFCPMALREMFRKNDLSTVYEAVSADRNAGTYLLFVGSRNPENWPNVLPDHDIVDRVGGWIGETTTRRIMGGLAAVRNARRKDRGFRMTVSTDVNIAERWFLDEKTGRRSRSLRDLASGARISPESLAWFLAVGFVPGAATLFDGVSCLPQGVEHSGISGRPQVDGHFPYEIMLTPEFLDIPEPDLIREGIRRWKGSVERLCTGTTGSPVVPLSGGIDSRAILCALLESVEARSIRTYTFGVPGTWDYDIGCRIAAHAGTKHTVYDLTDYEFTGARLATIADLCDASCDLFCHAPYEWIVRDFGTDDATYWIGFMGNPSAGSHIPNEKTLHELGDQYTLQNNRYATGVRLEEALTDGPARGCLKVDLPEVPSGSLLSLQELWDFKNRQERYVAPIVFLRGLNYATPFLDPEWLSFSLSLPLRLRRNQGLYKKMLLEAYPDMFSLPVKNNLGLPLNARQTQIVGARVRAKAAHYLERLIGWKSASRGANYIAFDHGLRDRPDLNGLVDRNLENLKKRDVLDADSVDRLWAEHKLGRANHAKALTLLASLEIILQTFLSD